MREGGVGRVAVACLHQSIADILPDRLPFYENWLNAEGMREGSIGLAPLYAVLSFLRQEGEVYDLVTARAGEYAAEWTVESMRPLTRAAIGRLPRAIRGRMVLRRARAMVRSSYEGSRVSWRVRQGTARVDLRASIFCSVRERVNQPLCRFYAAAFERMLTMFDLSSAVTVESCRASGGGACVLCVPLNGSVSEPSAEAA
jgi:hypothetical protein